MRHVTLLFVVLSSVALAGPPEPVDVRRAVAGGGWINWTTMELEASASVVGTGVGGSQEATEQQARRRISPAMVAAVRAIPVTSAVHSSELLDRGELAEVLHNRIKLWAVTEARYHTSGKVHLEGRLSLSVYLRPWSLQRASHRPGTPTVSEFSGLVVDARGSGVSFAFAPRILDDEGGELWDGQVWRDRVLEVTPVVYVADPAHPVAARAGERPLVVRAQRATGPDLILSGPDVHAVRRHVLGSPALHEGRVVVLVDP
ncbi:MAG: hypothetical protein EA397_14005 [Deltaproteobacteria bacterium]|nr:MAG: hypothetical protein EA397_14005 [Deltaproteobacteria bacterium]